LEDNIVKVTISGQIAKDANGVYRAPLTLGKGLDARTIQLDIDASYEPDSQDLIRPLDLAELPADGPWVYCGTAVCVTGSNGLSLEEVKLKIKHAVLRRDKALERMRREVEALENLELVKVGRRERIPDSVRLFVWQRDKGKCVRCGSAEKLEFDHIIPVVKGGSNTERNIQLLCERCNRKKGGDI